MTSVTMQFSNVTTIPSVNDGTILILIELLCYHLKKWLLSDKYKAKHKQRLSRAAWKKATNTRAVRRLKSYVFMFSMLSI